MKDINRFVEHGQIINHEMINEFPTNISVLVAEELKAVSRQVTPIWDSRDHVAVNPFFGFKDKNFSEVSEYLKGISGVGIFPKKSYFLKQYERGEITDYDLETAIKLYGKSESTSLSSKDLIGFIKSSDIEIEFIKKKCISDLFDQENMSDLTNQITEEVSKWAAAYFDEGQALWNIKDQQNLYSWWKSLVIYESPLGLDKNGFSKYVKELPNTSQDTIEYLTSKVLSKKLVSQNELGDYYYRLIYTILGWASFIKKFEFESERSQEISQRDLKCKLVDILAIRMTYDLLFLDKIENLKMESRFQIKEEKQTHLLSNLWLSAAEVSYRRKIEVLISEKLSCETEIVNPDIQAAFCIDVRSEVFRRHLENVSPKIQTLGVAGFFGMPVAIKRLGHVGDDQNCPILLEPKLVVKEAHTDESSVIEKKKRHVNNFSLKKEISSSANASFSFVETLGFSYVGKILSSSFSLKKEAKKYESISVETESLSNEDKINMAFNALKNMSLTTGFANYIFFFGHGSESTNNPYASSLDCGACAGHNGQGNANMLAKILNEDEVRLGLKERGIEIPNETIFLSGWHNTVTDEISIDSHFDHLIRENEKLDKFKSIFQEATSNCQLERLEKLPKLKKKIDVDKELKLKANDWSEVRPEWGLARNSSFIIGRRSLTRSLNLDGRSFLHDYNHELDHDNSVLELIMTAPMIVTNWINMQYYASTVNPKSFGAGNKVINNVVGGIGCIQGNGGDLLMGLSQQSVLNKGDYFHEPLRLQVFIEAKTEKISEIINKHQVLSDLINNNWLQIVSIDPSERVFKLLDRGSWIQLKEELWN